MVVFVSSDWRRLPRLLGCSLAAGRSAACRLMGCGVCLLAAGSGLLMVACPGYRGWVRVLV